MTEPAADAVLVRDALPEEYAAVGELTARVYLDGGFTTPESAYVDVLRDAAGRAAHGTLLVAVDPVDGRLLGTATVVTAASGPDWAENAGPHDAVLRMLAVAPEGRGHGVGTALTNEALNRARALGCTRMVLSTQREMLAAHRLYERLGFVRVPERDWEPVPDVVLLGYVLDL